jgi:hypothetical protein
LAASATPDDHPGYFILLEGYLRSFLFMRDAPSDAQILIWQPVSRLKTSPSSVLVRELK